MTDAELREGVAMAAEARGVAHRVLIDTDSDAAQALTDKLLAMMHGAPNDVALCAIAAIATGECLRSPDPSMLSMTLGHLIAAMMATYTKPADEAVH